MLENKLLINLYILSTNSSFDIFIPIDEKVGNIVRLLKKSLLSLDKDYLLMNLYSNRVYNYNDIIRDTDIQNGTRLMLI